ncbi:MAG: acyltransferase [Pseudomonadales bacterium]|nr:acyltransferase [Pseudomonadales bacterium]
MLWFLPGPIKGVIAFLIMLVNTVVMCTPLFLLTLLKLLIPISAWQTIVSRWLIVIAESWVLVNNFAIAFTQRIEWDVQGLDDLKYSGWYMVSCNHQSWVDILILQKFLTKRVPFLKFFLKQELIWVPILGVAWWALDFPFMKRFSKEYLAKHPEMKGKDLETTQKACEKFKEIPVSVMNFFEGTRFTPAKHKRQESPYQYLLKPKSGGLAYVLSAMGGQLHAMLDVTIVYQQEKHEFWDFLFGRVNKVVVRVTEREIPEEMAQGDYENHPEFRAHFQSWVSEIWGQKDQQIAEIYQTLR